MCATHHSRCGRLLSLVLCLMLAVSSTGFADSGPGSGPPAGDGTAVELLDIEAVEQLCGWATHDSCPLPEPGQVRRTSPAFDTSIAAAAGAACAGSGISVQQLVEPFAMVGPNLAGSLSRVREFQQWWSQTVETAELAAAELRSTQAAAAEETADVIEEFGSLAASTPAGPQQPLAIDAELNRLAAEEPIDVRSYGLSILVRDDCPRLDTKSYHIIGAATAQAGASAIIVTIEDAYLPYDLSARDLKVWSVTPLVTQPFCVRGESDEAGWMTLEMDRGAEVDLGAKCSGRVAAPPPGDDRSACPAADDAADLRPVGSPQCLLDECVWRVSGWVDDHRPTVEPWSRPKFYGRQVVRLAFTVRQATSDATRKLAAVWPEVAGGEADPEATAGQRLLARAEAIVADRPAGAEPTEMPARWPAVRLAELPCQTQR